MRRVKEVMCDMPVTSFQKREDQCNTLGVPLLFCEGADGSLISDFLADLLWNIIFIFKNLVYKLLQWAKIPLHWGLLTLIKSQNAHMRM